MVMAQTINNKKEGPFANVYFDKDPLHERRTAAWMHDIGMVATPVQIAEKGKKVETEGLKKKAELLEKETPTNEIRKLEEETEKKIQEIMDAKICHVI